MEMEPEIGLPLQAGADTTVSTDLCATKSALAYSSTTMVHILSQKTHLPLQHLPVGN